MNRTNVWNVAALVLALMSSCKPDSKATKELSSKSPIANNATSGTQASAPQSVRLKIVIDGRSTEFTIPAAEPASMERESWAKQLCIFAVVKAADEAELQMALLPKDPTHASIDLAIFKKQIILTRTMKPSETITLRPADVFPGNGLGESAPLEMSVTWIR